MINYTPDTVSEIDFSHLKQEIADVVEKHTEHMRSRLLSSVGEMKDNYDNICNLPIV